MCPHTQSGSVDIPIFTYDNRNPSVCIIKVYVIGYLSIPLNKMWQTCLLIRMEPGKAKNKAVLMNSEREVLSSLVNIWKII